MTELNRPRVSVCIPVYNGENYIAIAINSVLSQTFNDFELIIVDDYSTDHTGNITGAFKDPRLSYFRNERRLGLVGNWNRCISLAKGEYACLLHHDDYYLPNTLEGEIKLFENNPNVGFVFCANYAVDSNGKVLDHWGVFEKDIILEGIDILRSHITVNLVAAMSGVMVKRSCYDTVGNYDPGLIHCPDWDIWLRIELQGYQVGYIAEPLVNYRIHDESVTSGLIKNGLINLEKHKFFSKILLDTSRVSPEAYSPDRPYLAIKAIFTEFELNEFRKKAFGSLIDSEMAFCWLEVKRGEFKNIFYHFKVFLRILAGLEKNLCRVLLYNSFVNFLRLRACGIWKRIILKPL